MLKLTLLIALLLCTFQGRANDSTHVEVNGFLSAVGGWLDTKEARYYRYSDRLSFDSDSVFGMQLSAEIRPGSTLTGQFIARSGQEYATKVDWAYINHVINESWFIRAGRLRAPLFMYSDHKEVGYSYVWIRPPGELYDRVPFNGLNGFESVFNQLWEQWEFSLGMYLGSFHEDISVRGESVRPELENFSGLTLNFQRDWLNLRFGYHRAKITTVTEQSTALLQALRSQGFNEVAQRIELSDKLGEFLGFAVQLDYQSLLFIAEYAQIDLQRSLSPDNQAWFVTFGYRPEKDWLFHLTYSSVDSDAHHGLSEGIPSGAMTDPLIEAINTAADTAITKQSSTTLGLRYDYVPGIALKLELQYIDVDHRYLGDVVPLSGNDRDDIIFTSLAVDVVF